MDAKAEGIGKEGSAEFVNKEPGEWYDEEEEGKLVGDGGCWHCFSAVQRNVVYPLLVLAFGAGILFGLFIGVSF